MQARGVRGGGGVGRIPIPDPQSISAKPHFLWYRGQGGSGGDN